MKICCRRAGVWALVLGVAGPSIGCATKAQTGALVGGAGGAAVGAGIGSLSHSRAGEGALIGAAVGTVGGYIVGNEMDKADARERERQRSAYTAQPAPVYGASPTYAAPAYTAPPPPSSAARGASIVSKREVIRWSGEGLKDEIIIDRIERAEGVARITAGDENDLRDAGVSEEVVRAMKDAAWRR